MAYIMEPPKPAYLTDTSSLKSFRTSNSIMSMGAGSLKARSFILRRGTRKSPKIKDPNRVEHLTAESPAPKIPITSSAYASENLNAQSQLVDAPKPKKSFLQKISSPFRRDPKASSQIPVPSLSPATRQQRDVALRERGLLPPQNPPPSLGPQEPVQVSGPPEVLSNAQQTDDWNTAAWIRQDWKEKSRLTEAEQLASFKFGGQPVTKSFVGPLAVKLNDEVPSTVSARKKAPTALKLDRARLGPLGPPPDRALPPSPSDPEYRTYFSQPPSTNPSYRPTKEPSSPQSTFSISNQAESSHYSPTVEETFDPSSLSPPILYPISTLSDDSSSIVTPSLCHSSICITHHLVHVVEANGIIDPHVPIIVEGDDGPLDTIDWYKDEEEIDPDRPSPLISVSRYSGHSDESFGLGGSLQSTTNQKPSDVPSNSLSAPISTPPSLRPSVNPTMHTPGSISEAIANIEDGEAKRLTEVAFLS